MPICTATRDNDVQESTDGVISLCSPSFPFPSFPFSSVPLSFPSLLPVSFPSPPYLPLRSMAP